MFLLKRKKKIKEVFHEGRRKKKGQVSNGQAKLERS